MSTDPTALQAIYNAGERLIPGETHDRAETVRHKSSYRFFRKIIEADILSNPEMLKNGIRILDIGCGTGHGTFMLSHILGAKIVGVDPSIDSIQYAQKNYSASNIEYLHNNAEDYASTKPTFDYVVSRHALEHVENGLNFALEVDCRKRLMVNVPFNESEGNIHHKVHWIKEEHFDPYPNKEFFYEGLDGLTTTNRTESDPPNSIICISSTANLTNVKDMIPFPFFAWQPEFLQELGLIALSSLEMIQQKESALQEQRANLLADLDKRVSAVAEKETELNQRETILQASLCARIHRRLQGIL